MQSQGGFLPVLCSASIERAAQRYVGQLILRESPSVSPGGGDVPSADTPASDTDIHEMDENSRSHAHFSQYYRDLWLR